MSRPTSRRPGRREVSPLLAVVLIVAAIVVVWGGYRLLSARGKGKLPERQMARMRSQQRTVDLMSAAYIDGRNWKCPGCGKTIQGSPPEFKQHVQEAHPELLGGGGQEGSQPSAGR